MQGFFFKFATKKKIMKKLITIILMAAVLFTACTKDDSGAADKIATINATIIGYTKAALGTDDETKVNWTENDVIHLNINASEYPFTWKEGTAFVYTGEEPLPELANGTQITAAYANAYSTSQTGLKDDLGNYIVLSAEKTVTTEKNYRDLNLAFFHGTSVMKLTLSNEDFKGKEVTGITLKSDGEVIVTATATFVGDANKGNVIAYLAVLPNQLQYITIHATCDSEEYIAAISDKEQISGKLYNDQVEMIIADDYVDEYGINHGKGVEIDGVIWAPVNCGYHATDFKFGKLYQWGRKHGQGYSGNLYDDDYDVIGVHTDGSTPVIKTGGVSPDEGNNRNNADVFYTTSKDLMYNWSTGTNTNLWNKGSEDKPIKTKYDPCPLGWRVPTLNELTNIKKNSSGWRTNRNTPGYCGYYLSGSKSYNSEVAQIFLPAAGSLTYTKGTATGRGECGYYWSSKTDGNFSCFLEFDSTNSGKTNASVGRACGYAVRCVRE